MDKEADGYYCGLCGTMQFADEIKIQGVCACGVATHMIPIRLYRRWDGELFCLDLLNTTHKSIFMSMREDNTGSLDNDETSHRAVDDEGKPNYP